jgi:hypothetical protein
MLTSLGMFFNKIEVIIAFVISIIVLSVGIYYLTKDGDYVGGVRLKQQVHRTKVPVKMSYKGFGAILIAIGVVFLGVTYLLYTTGKKQKWQRTNPSSPVWWIL